MKRCVCTLHYNDKNSKMYNIYKFFEDYAIPTIKDYADRLGVDFVKLDKNDKKFKGTWNQLRCFELLDHYGQIMYIDGDCFIDKKFNENMFDIVPKFYIGVDKSSVRKHDLMSCNNMFYLLVVGKEYRDLFINNLPDIEKQTRHYYPCIFDRCTCYSLLNDNQYKYGTRLQREECWLNQIIYQNNLNNNIIDLSYYFSKYIDHARLFRYNDTKFVNKYILKKLTETKDIKNAHKYIIKKKKDDDKMIELFHPNVTPRMIDNVTKTLSSKWIAQGPQVKEFEKKFSEKISGYYPVATNSTTGALHLAYILSDIQEGDDVVSTCLTCTATHIPLLWMKANIIFSDIQKETMNIDPVDVEKKITNKTKAIVCVNYSGYPCDFEHLRYLADKHKCKLICDNAHGIKTTYKGKKIEDWCDYVIYSFQAIKFITTGDGGMIVCKSKDEEKLLKKLRWFGIDKEEKMEGTWDGKVDVVGYKYHMNDIAASMGIAALEDLDLTLMEHEEKFLVYKQLLPNHIPSTDERFNSWLFTIFHEKALDLQEYLKDHNIESGQIHYRNDQYKIFGGKKLNLPNMNYMEDKYLVLPMNAKTTLDEIEHICQTVKSFK